MVTKCNNSNNNNNDNSSIIRQSKLFIVRCALISVFIILNINLIKLSDGCYVAVGGIDPCDGLVCRPGARCRVSQDGQNAECHCPESCPDYGDHSGSRPVCGEDGKDYRDMCSLDKASCATEHGINIKYQGPCGQYTVYLISSEFFPK
ncbi:hypothetical protein O3M35_001847 [Rhynocoris fuscipes]|uniref:Kazal-like domain-containing protein n=1 Tax=Rhynocoris fuscipes TaxID=488301 RepID=A0AAW1CQC8_9HEMI